MVPAPIRVLDQFSISPIFHFTKVCLMSDRLVSAPTTLSRPGAHSRVDAHFWWGFVFALSAPARFHLTRLYPARIPTTHAVLEMRRPPGRAERPAITADSEIPSPCELFLYAHMHDALAFMQEVYALLGVQDPDCAPELGVLMPQMWDSVPEWLKRQYDAVVEATEREKVRAAQRETLRAQMVAHRDMMARERVLHGQRQVQARGGGYGINEAAVWQGQLVGQDVDVFGGQIVLP